MGQCGGLFVLGVAAGRRGWLTGIPPDVRRVCATVSLAGAVVVTALLAAFHDDLEPLGGGPHWQAAVVAVLEGAVSVSAAVFLVDLFRGRRRGPLGESLRRRAYGAFVVQTPVLVGLALLLRPLPVPAVVKLAVLVPAACCCPSPWPPSCSRHPW